MATSNKDPLIGLTVRINADASTPRGACPFAGHEAVVEARTPGGRQYQLRVGKTMLNLPMSEFAVPTAADNPQAQEHSAPLAALAPSRTNRPVREDEDLLTMAATMKVMGVLQPILVRPLPASRLQDTFESLETRKAQYEIIAGERRFHAARIAGLKSVPILLRDADDANALVMQLVENLHRKDLNPLEEARGLQRLIDEHSYTREDAAEAVNKGRTHVFDSLRLLNLCPEALAALEQGSLKRSMALLVAQRPTQAMQAEFCKRILTEGPDNGPLSYRSALDLAKRSYMTDLAQAPFALADAELCHKAGACTNCPKRTGANPELWDNKNGADICTDTACFSSKKDAHYERMHRQAQERGQKVITGREAHEIMPTDNATPAGYLVLDKHSQGSTAPVRQVLGQDVPAAKVVLIEKPSGGFVEAISTRVAGDAVAQAKAKADKPKSKGKASKAGEPAPTREALEAQYQTRWRAYATDDVSDALRELRDGSEADAKVILADIPTKLMERIMFVLAMDASERGLYYAFNQHQLHTDTALLKLEIEQAARKPWHYQNAVLMLLAIDTDRVQASGRPQDEALYLEAAAALVDIDLKAVRTEAQREMNQEAVDRTIAASPAKKAKVKANQAEMSSALDEAMQSADNPNSFEVGDQVRIRIDLKSATGKLLKTNGEMGEITGKAGDRAWTLDCPALDAEQLIADYTELELL